jgi:hypothetical protein
MDFFAISEVKRLLRWFKPRWEDNTKIAVQGVGTDLDWTVLSQDKDKWLLLMR